MGAVLGLFSVFNNETPRRLAIVLSILHVTKLGDDTPYSRNLSVSIFRGLKTFDQRRRPRLFTTFCLRLTRGLGARVQR